MLGNRFEGVESSPHRIWKDTAHLGREDSVLEAGLAAGCDVYVVLVFISFIIESVLKMLLNRSTFNLVLGSTWKHKADFYSCLPT